MTSEYLWDGTGAVDRQVAELEELLGELRYDRPWQPAAAPRRRGLATAVLAAAAGVAAVVTWGAMRPSTPVTEERFAATEASAVAGGTSKLVNPFTTAPTPRSAPSGAQLNSYKDERPAPKSASRPSKLLNPFEDAPAPAPPSSNKQDVIDPWAAPAERRTLGASDVAPVVARHRAEIASMCWRPARDRAPVSAPKSTRVTLNVQIAATGRVASATASDAPGYPGLGSCIEARAKLWVFPAASGTTTINVPFVFSR